MIDYVENVLTFYASGALVVGTAASLLKNPQTHIGPYRLRYPRVSAFFICGAAWPYLLYRLARMRS